MRLLSLFWSVNPISFVSYIYSFYVYCLKKISDFDMFFKYVNQRQS